MPEAVVDLLEVVDIEEDKRERMIEAPRPPQLNCGLGQNGTAVNCAGQLVHRRRQFQLFLKVPAFGDVVCRPDDAHRNTVGIANDGALGLYIRECAVLPSDSIMILPGWRSALDRTAHAAGHAGHILGMNDGGPAFAV